VKIYRRLLSGVLPLVFGLVVQAVGFGACAPRVVASQTSVPVPKRFTDTGDAKLPLQWWKAFRDPDLDRLVEQALSGNFDLRIAWARLDQARAAARKAGADLYPQIDGKAGLDGTVSKPGNSASLMLGVAATYEIDLWGRVRATQRAAQLDALASREALRAAAISLSAEVATVWYQLVERQGQLGLLTEQIALSDKVLAVVTSRFGQGLARAPDILQQKQLIEALRGERSRIRAEAQVLRHQLAALTGMPPGKLDVASRRTLPAVPALPQTGVPAQLLKQRPDVRAAYYQVRATDARVAAAVADRFPRLSLSANASVSGGFNPVAFYSWLANLAANLLAPIFDGGRRKAEVARARAAAVEAIAAYGKVVLVALREVEDALVRERQRRRYLNSLDTQVRLSKTVIAQLRQQYGNGEAEYLRVLDALIKHQTLTRTRLSSQRNLVLDRLALCRALAGGWELRRNGAKARRDKPSRTKGG